MKIGLSHSDNIQEIITEIKEDMGVPEEDVLVIAHVKRKDVERVCGALELAGVVETFGVMRPTERRNKTNESITSKRI